MKRLYFFLLAIILFSSSDKIYGQETYCTNPVQSNTNTTSPITFTSTASVSGYKYYTSGQITASGTAVVVTGNKRFYSSSRVSLGTGFKATSSATTKFVAAIGSCTTPATKIQEPITKDELVKGNIVLFPNPTTTSFTSVFNEVEVSSLSIYSIEGKQIYFQEHLEGQKELEVEVAQLPEGVYTVMYLTTQGENIAKKFVKIKG